MPVPDACDPLICRTYASNQDRQADSKRRYPYHAAQPASQASLSSCH